MFSPLVRNDKRFGFRVVVAELPETVQQRLNVRLTFGGRISPATVLDLSLSGMLVGDLDLDVKVGDSVTVALEFDGLPVILGGAIVRAIDDGSVGIRFPDSIKEGEFDPPIPLSNLHRRLERIWLKSREK